MKINMKINTFEEIKAHIFLSEINGDRVQGKIIPKNMEYLISTRDGVIKGHAGDIFIKDKNKVYLCNKILFEKYYKRIA